MAAAIVKNIDVTNKLPARIVMFFDTFKASSKFFLFFVSFSATGVIVSIIFDKHFEPNVANNPVPAAIVKNIDVTNKLPVRIVMFFDTFKASSKFFLLFLRVMLKGIKLFIVVSIFFVAFVDIFANNDVRNNFIIVLFSEEINSLRSFMASFALLKVSLFFCNTFDIINKDEDSPINIFFNFSIVLNLVSIKTFILIFDNDSIISGAALIILRTLSKVFLFIFKSSFDLFNIFDIRFNFILPTIISFNEMFLSLLNALTRVDIPPPSF